MLRLKYIGLLMVFMLPLAAQAQELKLSTNKDAYWRYELVKLIATQVEGQTPTAQATVKWPKTLKATVWFNDQQIITVGGRKETALVHQASGEWEGLWPIPKNPKLGKYTSKISVFQEGTTTTASANFTIQGRQAHELPKGFSVVTDEGGKQGPWKTPGQDPDAEKSWKNLVVWADYMGADAFWQCIGQTQVWGALKPEEFPWSAAYVRLADKVGAAAHEAGLKYGAWITAFVVIGDKPQESGYQFTSGYDRATHTLRPLKYVSQACEDRIVHIIELLKKFEASPNVDYLGLDYMRMDFGGYEFATEFVRDMAVPTPPEWEKMSETERSIWLGHLIEVVRSPAIREEWQWWRAHHVALIIERIVAEVKPTKPIWVFSLGWKTGHQHGQDLLMMLDAGIGFNAPMFYSVNKPDYPVMLKEWKTYLKQSPASVVIGQCVDWNLLGRTFSPSGPGEHLWRQEGAIKEMLPAARSFGLFWHDLARAFYGARGPYGSLEWIMSGAASFTQVKAAAERYPFQVEWTPPKQIRTGQVSELEVKVTHLRGNTLSAMSVELVPLPRLIRLDETPRVIHNLGPQNQVQAVQLRFRVDQVYEKNGCWQTVAIRVTNEDDKRNPWFDFVTLPMANAEGVSLAQVNEASACSPHAPLAGQKKNQADAQANTPPAASATPGVGKP